MRRIRQSRPSSSSSRLLRQRHYIPSTTIGSVSSVLDQAIAYLSIVFTTDSSPTNDHYLVVLKAWKVVFRNYIAGGRVSFILFHCNTETCLLMDLIYVLSFSIGFVGLQCYVHRVILLLLLQYCTISTLIVMQVLGTQLAPIVGKTLHCVQYVVVITRKWKL